MRYRGIELEDNTQLILNIEVFNIKEENYITALYKTVSVIVREFSRLSENCCEFYVEIADDNLINIKSSDMTFTALMAVSSFIENSLKRVYEKIFDKEFGNLKLSVNVENEVISIEDFIKNIDDNIDEVY